MSIIYIFNPYVFFCIALMVSDVIWVFEPHVRLTDQPFFNVPQFLSRKFSRLSNHSGVWCSPIELLDICYPQCVLPLGPENVEIREIWIFAKQRLIGSSSWWKVACQSPASYIDCHVWRFCPKTVSNMFWCSIARTGSTNAQLGLSAIPF